MTAIADAPTAVSNHDLPQRGYAGRVLATGEMNYHDDSDFYAVVWTGSEVRRVGDGTTRYADPPRCRADADESVRELAAQWMETSYWPDRIRSSIIAEAKLPKFGRWAKVVAGRKIPHGTRGEIFYAVERRSQFGTWSYGVRVGLRLLDGSRVFTDAKNIEVEYKPVDEHDVARSASNRRSDFRAVGAVPAMVRM